MLHVYTIEQVRAFEEGAHENRMDEIVSTATAFRASQSPNKDWKKYVEAVTGTGKKKAPPRVSSAAEINALRRMSGGKAR